MEELYCPNCQEMTQQEFQYQVMDYEEERAVEEAALDEMEQEGIGGRLMVRLMRWDPVRQGLAVGREIWNVLDLDDVAALRGKKVYICQACGGETYV